VAYISKRAISPTDSEYFSGGYESACMETPTQSPLGSPLPPKLAQDVLSPYDELKRHSFVTSDSEAYVTSNEHGMSDVESIRTREK
jgi:hypothetical protein